MSETTSTLSSRMIIRRLQISLLALKSIMAGAQTTAARSSVASSTSLHTAAFSRHPDIRPQLQSFVMSDGERTGCVVFLRLAGLTTLTWTPTISNVAHRRASQLRAAAIVLARCGRTELAMLLRISI